MNERLDSVTRTFARLGGQAMRGAVDRTGVGRAAERVALGVVDRALASGVADQIAARILNGPELERIAASAVESQGVNRVADRVVNSPGMEGLVARVIESRLMDEAVARLLDSDDLWILVDVIARSPAVTDAISHQGMGFADQVAGVVRERSRRADTRLEHAARRLVGRNASTNSEPPPGP